MNRRLLPLLATCFYATSALGAKPFLFNEWDTLVEAGKSPDFDPVVKFESTQTTYCTATKIKTPPGVWGNVYLTAASCLNGEEALTLTIDGHRAAAFFRHPLFSIAPQYNIGVFLMINQSLYSKSLELSEDFLKRRTQSQPQFYSFVYTQHNDSESSQGGWTLKPQDTPPTEEQELFYHVGYGVGPEGTSPRQAVRIFPAFNEFTAQSTYDPETMRVYEKFLGTPSSGDLGGPLLRKDSQNRWTILGVLNQSLSGIQTSEWSIGIEGLNQLMIGIFGGKFFLSTQPRDLTEDGKTLYPKIFQEAFSTAALRLKNLPVTQKFFGMLLALSNPFEAREYFLRAGAQGNKEAQRVLGSMLYQGEGGPQNLHWARYCWEQAARQGHSFAQTSLGSMLSNGEGGPKDQEQARYWFEEAAKQGDMIAQNQLGFMLSKGEGGAEGTEKASYWFQQAAKQGNIIAQKNLGVMFHFGQGVAKDKEQARYWYELAAYQGNTGAQLNLGLMLFNGEGGAKDYKKARYWFQQAADQGDREAQFNLACMLDKGEGGKKDPKNARYWFEQAAIQGYEDAQFNLGLMLSNGEGGAKDYKKALYWFQQAAKQGNAKAMNVLKKYFNEEL